MSRVVFAFTFALCLYAQNETGKAWTILANGVQDSNKTKRSQAVHALGMLSTDKRAKDAAMTALDDPDEDVRTSAATALGQMGAKDAAPKLREKIRDKASAVIFAAANALILLEDPEAFKVFFAVLTQRTKSGDSLMESQMKMLKDPKSLTKIGVSAGIGFVPFGGVGMQAFNMMRSDTVSPVRAAAAMKLAKDPDPLSMQALLDALKDPKWIVRAAAVNALVLRKDNAAVNAMAPLLEDENDIVRFNAAAGYLQLSSLAGR